MDLYTGFSSALVIPNAQQSSIEKAIASMVGFTRLDKMPGHDSGCDVSALRFGEIMASI